MEETPITLKGTADGILLKPRALDWATVLEALEHALKEADAFFRGGRLIVELEHRELLQEQLTSLRDLLVPFDIELWAILSENENTVRLARSNGVLTRLPKRPTRSPDTDGKSAPAETLSREQQALFLRQTLRSGQTVNYAGHVTLIGDVNPGGEIVAGGNIIVWGTLRGVAHAGAYGDEDAVICALDLQPSQIRIAGHIGRAPDRRRGPVGPEIARVEGDQIIAENWSRKG